MKKVIIVHGWGFSPKDNWYEWLAGELRGVGFEVVVPEMPETETPHIDTWIPSLRTVAGNIDQNTYFVGHRIEYDYQLDLGWEKRDDVLVINPKTYCEAYLKAFSLGGKIWQYDKIFNEEQLLQIHERIVRKFENK